MEAKIIKIEVKNGVAEVVLKTIPKGIQVQVDDYDAGSKNTYTSTLWANDGIVNVSRIED